jgi:hypothetical protein
MKPWIIDRIEKERRDQEWAPQPLHIHRPPPEWIEEQERRREEQPSSEEAGRGVWIFQM